EHEPQDGLASGRRRQPARKRGGLKRCAGQGNGPKSHGIARGKPARQTIHRFTVQQTLTVNEESVGQLSPRGIQLKLQDAHGRQRRQVMGIKRLEKRRGNLRKLVVKLMLDASGQEGSRFDQAFYFRIGAAIRLQQQPAGRVRIFLGKLLENLPEKEQFALVV